MQQLRERSLDSFLDQDIDIWQLVDNKQINREELSVLLLCKTDWKQELIRNIGRLKRKEQQEDKQQFLERQQLIIQMKNIEIDKIVNGLSYEFMQCIVNNLEDSSVMGIIIKELSRIFFKQNNYKNLKQIGRYKAQPEEYEVKEKDDNNQFNQDNNQTNQENLIIDLVINSKQLSPISITSPNHSNNIFNNPSPILFNDEHLFMSNQQQEQFIKLNISQLASINQIYSQLKKDFPPYADFRYSYNQHDSCYSGSIMYDCHVISTIDQQFHQMQILQNNLFHNALFKYANQIYQAMDPLINSQIDSYPQDFFIPVQLNCDEQQAKPYLKDTASIINTLIQITKFEDILLYSSSCKQPEHITMLVNILDYYFQQNSKYQINFKLEKNKPESKAYFSIQEKPYKIVFQKEIKHSDPNFLSLVGRLHLLREVMKFCFQRYEKDIRLFEVVYLLIDLMQPNHNYGWVINKYRQDLQSHRQFQQDHKNNNNSKKQNEEEHNNRKKKQQKENRKIQQQTNQQSNNSNNYRRQNDQDQRYDKEEIFNYVDKLFKKKVDMDQKLIKETIISQFEKYNQKFNQR